MEVAPPSTEASLMIPKLAVDMKNGYRRQVKNRVIEGRTVNRQVSFGVSRGLFAPAKFLIDVINAYPVSLSLSLKKKKKKNCKKKTIRNRCKAHRPSHCGE